MPQIYACGQHKCAMLSIMRKKTKPLLYIMFATILFIVLLIWNWSYKEREEIRHHSLAPDSICSRLFKEKNDIMEEGMAAQRSHARTAYEIIDDAANCDVYKQTQDYILEPVNEIEANFSLAFTILLYKEPAQFEKLLRTVYRSQNYYCVHVDRKSQPEVALAVMRIVSCFSNVFVLTPSIDVVHGWYTVLEPEMKCMEQLLAYNDWRYFINLTGQEFPIRTNYELVEILNVYNNANDIEGHTMRVNPKRWGDKETPHGIQPLKGAGHIIATRAFIYFLLQDKRAVDFHEWTKSTIVPVETLFASVNFNQHLQAPGGYNGQGLPDYQSYNARKKIWREEYVPCKGKWVRDICIFGVGDLPWLRVAKEPFANKFHYDFQPYALDCMEEWYFERVNQEYEMNTKFDTTYYKKLSFVKNHF